MSASSASYADVIDRVLDKGIVVDAWLRLSVGGLDLLTIEAHVIVASIDTWLNHRPAEILEGIDRALLPVV